MNKISVNKLLVFKQNLPVARYQQQGLVLMVTLIALIIMMLASVALIRSTDANLQIAGNMAFKRDLINQAERAIPRIELMFRSGVLSDPNVRDSDLPGSNYFATIQIANQNGIPQQLIDMAAGTVNEIPSEDNSVKVNYIIDRMCLPYTKPEDQEKACTLVSNKPTYIDPLNPPVITPRPVYRMTLRVTGPRNTVAFLQTTYTEALIN